jgi:DNA repair exonuclease SbcCD nuclease subunit
MKPYGVISDTHHHNWSAFATTLPTGINSRLQMILDETLRCALEVQKAGGNTVYHCGDLFHVRGSIAPSVLNPTIDTYKAILDRGVRIVILAGNHDLESKEANRVSSAITALEGIGCKVVNGFNLGGLAASDDVAMIPWNPSIEGLKKQIESIDPVDRPRCDLMLHAPVDGVIPGIPDHGLDAPYLQSLGFRRVFCGHYHHHKDFGGGVFSIGSLTPQTWSDVGAKAGFLIVDETSVRWMKSHAPEFVEIDGSTDPADVLLIVDGNYVRAAITTAKIEEVEALREFLTSAGAKGVVLNVQKNVTAPTRGPGSTIKAGATLDASVGDYVKGLGHAREAEVAKLCQDILDSVRAVEA